MFCFIGASELCRLRTRQWKSLCLHGLVMATNELILEREEIQQVVVLPVILRGAENAKGSVLAITYRGDITYFLVSTGNGPLPEKVVDGLDGRQVCLRLTPLWPFERQVHNYVIPLSTAGQPSPTLKFLSPSMH